MSSISSGTTSTTGYVVSSDTTGALVLKTGSAATTAVTIDTSQNVTFAGSQTLSAGTANGVAYLNGSKVLTSGSALVFDGTNLSTTGNTTLATTSIFGASGTSAGLTALTVGDATNATFRMAFTNGPLIQFAKNTSVALAFGSKESSSGTFTEQMRLDASGRLLLGTTSVASAERAIIAFDSAGSISQGLSTKDTNASANGNAHIVLRKSDNTYIGSFGRQSTDTAMFVDGNEYLALRVNQTEGMRLTSTGLGIGTSSPAQKLHVLSSSATATVAKFAATNYGNLGTTYIEIGTQFGDGGSRIGSINPTGNQSTLVFETMTGTSGTYAERARITSDGTLQVRGDSTDATFTNAGQLAIKRSSGDPVLSFHANAGSQIGNIQMQASGTCSITVAVAQPLAFTVNGSERVRITSTGDFLIGTTAFPNVSGAGSAFINDGESRWQLRQSHSSTEPRALQSYSNPNGGVGSIQTSGSSTSFNTSSDYRLKNTIAPMAGALAKVALLKPCTYKWNCDGSDGQGFIAHELAEVVPQCVSGEKDAVDSDGKIKPQGIDTSFLVATLTAAIQEQQQLIQQLQADVAILKGVQQ